jgi:hypothetical protein
MSKQSGLGWTTASIDNSAGTLKALVNAFTSIEVATPIAVQEVTGLNKSAIERIHLMADASATFSGPFDPAADGPHDVFTPMLNARTVSLAHASQSLSMEMLLTDYPLTRGDDGSLQFAVPAVLADGTVPTWA